MFKSRELRYATNGTLECSSKVSSERVMRDSVLPLLCNSDLQQCVSEKGWRVGGAANHLRRNQAHAEGVCSQARC